MATNGYRTIGAEPPRQLVLVSKMTQIAYQIAAMFDGRAPQPYIYDYEGWRERGMRVTIPMPRRRGLGT